MCNRIEAFIKDKKNIIIFTIIIIALILRLISFNNNTLIHTPEDTLFVESLAEGRSHIDFWHSSGALSTTENKYVEPWFAVGFHAATVPLYKLTGDSYLSMQIYNLVLGTLLVILALRFFTKDEKDSTSMIYLTLITFSALLVDYSANESPYLSIAILSIAYLALLKSVSKGKWFSYLLMGIFLPSTLMIQTFSAVIGLSFALLILISKNLRIEVFRKWKLVPLALGGIIGLGIYGLYNWSITNTILPSQAPHMITKSAASSFEIITFIKTTILQTMITGNQLLFAITTLMVPLFLYGIYLMLKEFNKMDKVKKDQFIGMVLLIVASLAIMIFYNVKFRRFVPIAPILLFFASITLSRLYKDGHKILTAMIMIIFIIASAKVLVMPGTFYQGPSEEEWRDDYLTGYSFLPILKENGEGMLLDQTNSHGKILAKETRYEFIFGIKGDDQLLRNQINQYKPKYILCWEDKSDFFSNDYTLLEQNRDMTLLIRK